MKQRPAIVALAALVMLLGLSGCLVTQSQNENRSGKYVPESTFDQIQPGQTTAAWLLATLGEPSEKSKADCSEVWKWNYAEEKKSSGTVFLVFAGSNTKQTNGTAFVELKDGVVVRKWRA